MILYKQKILKLGLSVLMGLALSLASVPPVRAQIGYVVYNQFFGYSADQCGNNIVLEKPIQHKNTEDFGNKEAQVQTFYCLSLGAKDTYKMGGPGADNNCNTGEPVFYNVNARFKFGDGSVCIWMKPASVLYTVGAAGAPGTVPGGSTPGATPGAGTTTPAATPNSPSGGVNPQDTSGGSAQPNTPQETKTNEQDLAQGSCSPGQIEISQPLESGGSKCIKGDESGDQNPIFRYLRRIIQFLTGGVGIVIVMMVVIGGIQYITSTGNPQATAAAKGRITSAIMALLLFIFMFAILNFVVPGGLLS